MRRLAGALPLHPAPAGGAQTVLLFFGLGFQNFTPGSEFSHARENR